MVHDSVKSMSRSPNGRHNGNGNGNGNGRDHGPNLETTLDRVQQRIREKAKEVKDLGTTDTTDPRDDLDDWKAQIASNQEDLRKIHKGLVVIAETAEASIEAVVAVAQEQRLHAQRSAAPIESITVLREQVLAIGAKTEAVAKFADKTDRILAESRKDLGKIKDEVAVIKQDVIAIKDQINEIPALKEMLGEILKRLPPVTAPPRPSKKK